MSAFDGKTTFISAGATGIGLACALRPRRCVKEEGGGIVNVGSLPGTVTHPWMSGYCASKAGINMLSKCAADGGHNLRRGLRLHPSGHAETASN